MEYMNNIPKVLAMYLPQFHRVPENDRWWGEGFTEWVSARNAKPLFDGHYQPHIPLNENYYDLLDKKTMQWQTDLMHEYGVDGICMYHYWFQNGRRILEKPEQNLLKWKDIDMPFCLCWANESWARRWDNRSNITRKSLNIWQFDTECNECESILLQQAYGGYDQWKEHFDYLLPFFKDERYIRHNGCPLVLIYKPNEIKCLSEMILYWKKLAKESGLTDIYCVGLLCDEYTSDFLDACVLIEPITTIWSMYYDIVPDPIRKIDFDIFCKKSLEEKPKKWKTYFSGTVGYDDTPRRGLQGKGITNNTPEKFERYIYSLIKKNISYDNEFLFLNAWNEWGEGMHLEPDEKYGYAYLESVKHAKELVEKEIMTLEGGLEKSRIDYSTLESDRRDKHELYLNIMDQWMLLYENGRTISAYLGSFGYKRILVYGGGVLGRHLVEDLQRGGLDVVGIVDRNPDGIGLKNNKYRPEDQWPEYDCFIITSVFYKDEILHEISYERIHDCFSIDYIIDEILTSERLG